MKEFWNWMQAAIAAFGGSLGYFLGGLDGFLYSLLAFVVIDYFTGLMCAVLDKKLSSEVGFRGIFKKVLIFSLVAIGHIIDQSLIGEGSVIRTAVIFFYLSNEGISIIENAAKIGLPIPEKLKTVLEQLNRRTIKMNLHKLIFTNNACYKAGRTIKPKGIMVHSTGANNPWLKRYVGPDDGLLGKNQSGNHWNQDKPGGRQVCVHGFIGKLADGTIATYQTLPWNHRGWHAGGKANDSHIGFEICEDGLSDSAYFDRVYREAVELCVHLCKLYGLTEKNIICHSEGYKLGIASNHADVMHWFPRHGKSMDGFRSEVGKLLSASAHSQNEPSSWAKESWDWGKKAGITDGTNPKDLITREQTVAMLQRLNSISK